jgi:DNA polymerase-3 subunit beta
VRRVSLVAESGTPVRLAFGSGEVTIEAGSKGHARASEAVPAEFSGDEPDIAFSPQYLLDGVLAASSAARIQLDFTSATKPAVISGGEDFKYLVVPQRIYS